MSHKCAHELRPDTTIPGGWLMNSRSFGKPPKSPRWSVGLRLAVVGLLVTGGAADLGVARDVTTPTDQHRDPSAPLAACPAILTVLPNNGSYVKTASAPLTISRFERGVYLIRASELAANGLSSGSSISGIGWNYNLPPGVAGIATALKVYLENTGNTTMRTNTDWATEIGTMTLVHNGSITLGNFFSPIDVSFSGTGTSPFTYSGGGLYVAFDFGRNNAGLAIPSATTVGVLVNTDLVPGGLYGVSTASAPTSVTTSSSDRAETRLKATSSQQSDASVDQLMSLAVLPLGLVGPQTIQAVVTNRGALALTSLQVTLNITGAEAFTDTQIIASLAPCAQELVTFTPFTPTTVGSDTVEVSVASDDFAGNNSKSKPLSVTVPQYSYKYPGSTAILGLGGAGGPIAIVDKFAVTAASNVSAVNLDFFVPTATTYKVAIYADDGSGMPGSELYLDSANRTVAAAGPVTITLSPAVPVGPGNFFVGVQQTNSAYAYVSYDSEIPVRANSFFLSGVPPSTWSDFSPGNNFKPNIGVVLDRCNFTPTATNNGPLCAGATLLLQSSVPAGASYSWTGPNGFTSTQQNPSLPSATSAASGTYAVTVNGCSSPTTTSVTVVPSGAGCDDGNACTAGDVCGSGICSGTLISAPPETNGVSASADKATYSWSAAPFATQYDVVRGSTSALPVGPSAGDEVCFDNLPGPSLVDPAVPASGSAFWYLSRGENACGIGTYGTQSNGSPRITATCP